MPSFLCPTGIFRWWFRGKWFNQSDCCAKVFSEVIVCSLKGAHLQACKSTDI